MGIAGGLARSGHTVFVHSFGVFVTRRAYDQVAMAIAYPALDVKIVGFMPGVSSPGGPSHQAIDDVALMRGLPNMTVVDVADAVETEQVVRALADRPGPAYLRLKRGEIPVIFDSDHTFSLDRAQVLRAGDDVTIVASGMMLAGALAAAAELGQHGVGATVINAPVIKPLDAETIVQACSGDVGRRQRREPLGHRRARVGGRRGARRGRRRPSASPRRARGRLRRVRQPAVPVLEVRARSPAHRRPRVGGRVTRRRTRRPWRRSRRRAVATRPSERAVQEGRGAHGPSPPQRPRAGGPALPLRAGRVAGSTDGRRLGEPRRLRAASRGIGWGA